MAQATEQTIHVERLCQLTGLTDRRHRQLAKDGWFPPPHRGQYQLIPTLQGLFRYYRERGDSESPRGALLKAQREGQELRNKLRAMEVRQAAATLVPLDDAHEVVRIAFEPMKMLLDSLASNLSGRMANRPAEECRQELDTWSANAKRVVTAALEKAEAGQQAKPNAA